MGLTVSCYHLIEAERTSFTVPLMCRMLGVSRSGYYGLTDLTGGVDEERAPTVQLLSAGRSQGGHGEPQPSMRGLGYRPWCGTTGGR